MVELVASAAQIIPGVDAANLCARHSLVASANLHLVAGTSTEWRVLEDLQVDVGEGPSCLAAGGSAEVIVSGALQQDARWPSFGAQTSRHPMSSVMSLPLATPSGPVGVLSVYAQEADAFSGQAQELARVFAAPAALVLCTAQALARTQHAAAEEETRVRGRATVERAVALMMNRNGGDESRARSRLATMSRHEQQPVEEIAETIVAEALVGALARYSERSWAWQRSDPHATI